MFVVKPHGLLDLAGLFVLATCTCATSHALPCCTPCAANDDALLCRCPGALATPQGPPWFAPHAADPSAPPLSTPLVPPPRPLVHLCAGRPAATADHSASALHQHLPSEWHPHCSRHGQAAAAGGHGTVPGPPAGTWPAMECHHLATGVPTAGKHPQQYLSCSVHSSHKRNYQLHSDASDCNKPCSNCCQL